METLLFYPVALLAVLSGFLVVKCKNPVHSALALVLTFFCLALLYVALHAPFMAAIQIIVYAGAIMVLIMFVIMLLNLGTAVTTRTTHAVLGGVVCGLLVLFTSYHFISKSEVTGASGEMTAAVVEQVGHTELIGQALFTQFLLPFEIASILLLVAIVGAVVLAKREV